MSDSESSDIEYDEEEEEEEEEEEIPVKRPRRKRRKLVAQFLNEEVEVDDDDEEDDYFDDAGSEFGVDPREREEAERILREQERQHSQRNRFAEMSEEQLAEYFQARHEVSSARMNAGNEEYFDSVAENGLLPDAQAPNLYMVKCRIGGERKLCLQLMRKYMAFVESEEPLEILSIVIKENIKGMVYIEAFKTPHVLKAIEGISGFSAYNIKMVPKNELVDTLKIVRELTKPKKAVAAAAAAVSTVPIKFASGDIVEVIEGELIGLKGRIQSVERDFAYIKPENADLKDAVAVNIRELRKCFKVGDHVLVLDGRSKNDTGMVVKAEENLVIVFSDTTQEEIKALPRDLKLYAHVANQVEIQLQLQKQQQRKRNFAFGGNNRPLMMDRPQKLPPPIKTQPLLPRAQPVAPRRLSPPRQRRPSPPRRRELSPKQFFEIANAIPDSFIETNDSRSFSPPRTQPSQSQPSQRQPSPPKESAEMIREIPESLIESGDWCEVDMVIKVRRNCPNVQLHGKSLSIIKVDKQKREVQVKAGGERINVQFRDVVPVPPTEDCLGKVIFDGNSGQLYSNEDAKNVVAIEGDTVVFVDGSKALASHCVSIN